VQSHAAYSCRLVRRQGVSFEWVREAGGDGYQEDEYGNGYALSKRIAEDMLAARVSARDYPQAVKGAWPAPPRVVHDAPSIHPFHASAWWLSDVWLVPCRAAVAIVRPAIVGNALGDQHVGGKMPPGWGMGVWRRADPRVLRDCWTKMFNCVSSLRRYAGR
jgi:hypothetical protein